jgi:hypothetical protein
VGNEEFTLFLKNVSCVPYETRRGYETCQAFNRQQSTSGIAAFEVKPLETK